MFGVITFNYNDAHSIRLFESRPMAERIYNQIVIGEVDSGRPELPIVTSKFLVRVYSQEALPSKMSESGFSNVFRPPGHSGYTVLKQKPIVGTSGYSGRVTKWSRIKLFFRKLFN